LFTLPVTFLQKKYQNLFTYVKVIGSQRWDVFLRHSVVVQNSLSVCRTARGGLRLVSTVYV